MRPRPFRFFFGVAIAIMLVFFMARVFFVAMIFAAVASLFYYIFRGIGTFFRNMTWQEDDYDFRREYAMSNYRNDRRDNDVEPLFDLTPRRDFADFKRQERIIRVH